MTATLYDDSGFRNCDTTVDITNACIQVGAKNYPIDDFRCQSGKVYVHAAGWFFVIR